MATSKAPARKPLPRAKRTAPRAPKAVPQAPAKSQRRDIEPVSGVSAPKGSSKQAIERRYFGAVPAAATHILLTKHSANGAADRCFVNRNGVAEEKLALVYAQVDKLRKLWGPGTYRGQWLSYAGNKWRALGRTAEVRILPHVAEDSIARPSTRAIGDVVAAADDAPDVPRERALAQRDPDDVVDLRVKAERDIARMRLDAEREISDARLTFRLEEMRSENARAIRQLEERIDAGRGDDDDDDEPSPWAWVMPLLEKLRPTLEDLVPKLLANVAAKNAG